VKAAGNAVFGFRWQKLMRHRTQVLMDVCVLSFAFGMAYLLRFEFLLTHETRRTLFTQLPMVLFVQIGTMWAWGIYKQIWRYVGIADLKRIGPAAASATSLLLLLRLRFPGSHAILRVPLSVSLIDAILGFGGVVLLRVTRRVLFEWFEQSAERAGTSNPKRKPILLVGAGRAGVLAAREIVGRGNLEIEVKGFVDDDLEKVGSVVSNIKVLGTTKDLPMLVKEHGIDHVVITIAKASRREIMRIFKICEQIRVKARIIPGLYDILQGHVAVSSIRDVEIEDLLGRAPVQLDISTVRGFLTGKTVMVTGAGGSIGSELCRQVARFEPQRILLVERAEPFLFEIDRELKRAWQDMEIVPLVSDVTDAPRMQEIFLQWRPHVVLHAAAHKHVPMMELNPGEAVKNNVLGTETLAEIAGEFSAETFVLISTDKAVNPTSVMGATKRVAELVIQAMEGSHKTRYLAVRFGNVLGSTGSVIPIFKDQIRRGGPVTVTHPEMKRYFMTIPEASQLVLQAGAMGEGGEIFILDMGEPVDILSLAEDMIRLSGFRPKEDIEIVFTGLRPGEKLFEELGRTTDLVDRTKHPKIFVGRIPPADAVDVLDAVGRLREAAHGTDEQAIRDQLEAMVPEARLGPPLRYITSSESAFPDRK